MIHLPSIIAREAGGRREFEIEAATLRAALTALPVADLLFEPDGTLRRLVNVYVDGRDARGELDDAVAPEADVRVVAAVAGGAAADADLPFATTTLAELQRPSGWSPIRRHLDVRSFGINAWTEHEPGATVIAEHDEEPSGHEELYLVTAGHATFSVDGTEIDAPVGTVVLVRDPASKRGAVSVAAETTVVSVGGKPGAAYSPRAWETNADVIELFDRGEHAEAKRVLSDALDRYEDRSSVLYNLACAEALLGESDEALEHLRQAVEERPAFAATARDDEDLSSLRADRRFTAIVGG